MSNDLPNVPTSVELPTAGDIFERKYRIQSVVGSGGFARVYLAKFEDLGRDVAIKVLVPDENNQYPDGLDQRFLREAQTLADLRDPHTITMHDFGRSESGLLYMVFEFIDGLPIHELVRRDGAIESTRTLQIVRQILISLREAHAVGVLHRDIKPANIMVYDYLGETDRVKVLDFGIAKQSAGRQGEDLTQAGIIMGTPRYMSPEQICQQQLGPTTDIYSVGLVTFEMITGARAISATLDSEVIRFHLGPEPLVLPHHLPLHPDIRAIVSKMTHKDFRQRFQSVEEVIFAIDSLLNSGVLENTTAMAAPYIPRPAHVPTAAPVAPSFQQNVPATFSPPTSETQTQHVITIEPGAPLPAATPAPGNAVLKLRKDSNAFAIEVPTLLTKNALIIVGVGVVLAMLGTVVSAFLSIIGAAVMAFGAARAARTRSFQLDRRNGFQLLENYHVHKIKKQGAFLQAKKFETRNEDDTFALVLVTSTENYTIAQGLSDEESRWAATEGNHWMQLTS